MRCSSLGTLSLAAYSLPYSMAQPNKYFYLGYGDHCAAVPCEPNLWGTQKTLGPSLQPTCAAPVHAQEVRGVCCSYIPFLVRSHVAIAQVVILKHARESISHGKRLDLGSFSWEHEYFSGRN